MADKPALSKPDRGPVETRNFSAELGGSEPGKSPTLQSISEALRGLDAKMDAASVENAGTCTAVESIVDGAMRSRARKAQRKAFPPSPTHAKGDLGPPSSAESEDSEEQGGKAGPRLPQRDHNSTKRRARRDPSEKREMRTQTAEVLSKDTVQLSGTSNHPDASNPNAMIVEQVLRQFVIGWKETLEVLDANTRGTLGPLILNDNVGAEVGTRTLTVLEILLSLGVLRRTKITTNGQAVSAKACVKCYTQTHQGGKSKCPWKNKTDNEARAQGQICLMAMSQDEG